MPKPIEQADPGGVSCTTRTPSTGLDVHVDDEAELLGVERLGPVDVGDRDRHEFELHVHVALLVVVLHGDMKLRWRHAVPTACRRRNFMIAREEGQLRASSSSSFA